MIRVVLPPHLRTLAKVNGEVRLEVDGQVTQRTILEALESNYPVLCGTIRDHGTLRRRPFVRFFACEQDISHDSPDAALPEAVATGAEPFFVIGAIVGGQIAMETTLLVGTQSLPIAADRIQGLFGWASDPTELVQALSPVGKPLDE